jgi:hypothetical protein
VPTKKERSMATHVAPGRLERQVERQLQALLREFEGEIPPSEVTPIVEAHFARLREQARIEEFIPVLVYRYAREELRIRRDELHHAA